MVPTDEVEELVAGGEPYLVQALVCFDTGRQPDLVAIGPVPATSASVEAKERTTRAERAHLRREAFKRALHEEWPGGDIEIRLCPPQLIAETSELLWSKGALGEGEDDVSHRVRDRGS